MKTNIVISCEHGGNQIPSWIKEEVSISVKVLNSHRAYDRGAFAIAKKMAKLYKVKPTINKMSRLLIDYNRSPHHPKLWSSYTKNIDPEMRKKLFTNYVNYRDQVAGQVQGKTIHLSVHSFVPIMGGVKRNCDFALLYDPARKAERDLAQTMKRQLQSMGIHCRLNYPYQGKADGLTTYFRKRFGVDYLGFELEYNQAIVDNPQKLAKIQRVLQSII